MFIVVITGVCLGVAVLAVVVAMLLAVVASGSVMVPVVCMDATVVAAPVADPVVDAIPTHQNLITGSKSLYMKPLHNNGFSFGANFHYWLEVLHLNQLCFFPM